MANKYRDNVESEAPETVVEQAPAPPRRRPVKKGVLAKGLSSVFSGTFLAEERNLRHVPFIVFLALIAVLYIANGYYADDKIREANRLGNELKELRSEYISTKSELMFASKQSEVARAVAAMGLREPVEPPVKIEVDSARLFGN